MTRVLLPLLLVLALPAAELSLRARRGPAPDLGGGLDYFYLALREPMFKRDGDVYRENRLRATPQSFPMPKPAGLYRVAVVGGSVAKPFAGQDHPLVALLSRSLGRPVDLVGAGMGGYDSIRDLQVAREVLGFSPDLLVVLSGNNEYQPAIPNLTLLAAHRRLSAFWLYRGLRAFFGSDSRSLFRPVETGTFERNLRALVREARAKGVTVVLCALPANLRDAPPTSYGGHLPLGEPGFLEAWDAFESGRFAEAERGLAAFEAAHPLDPYSRFYRAKALERLGRASEAGTEYERAADLDLPSQRMPPARAELVRRIAKEEGALVADLEAELRALAPMRAPGREMFIDGCHWRAEYYRLVDAVIAAAVKPTPELERVRALSRHPGLDRISRAEASWAIAFSGVTGALLSDDRDGLNDEAVVRLGQTLAEQPALFDVITGSTAPYAPFMEDRFHASFVAAEPERLRYKTLVHAGAALRRAGKLARALAYFDEALALEPAGAAALEGRAMTLRRLGRRDGGSAR